MWHHRWWSRWYWVCISPEMATVFNVLVLVNSFGLKVILQCEHCDTTMLCPSTKDLDHGYDLEVPLYSDTSWDC